MIKACLFDLDGTVLDTLQSIKYYLNKTLAEFGIDGVSTEETKIFVGKGAKNLVLAALDKYGIDGNSPENVKLCSQILEKYVKDYNDSPYYLTKPYDGIPELIDELYKRGIKLAVISNKPKDTVVQLVERFFGDKFDIVEGQSDAFPIKPDPTLAIDILKRLDTDADSVAYFGDTGTDMKTGVNLKAAFNVGVLWGFREKSELVEYGATHTVAHPSEILDIII